MRWNYRLASPPSASKTPANATTSPPAWPNLSPANTAPKSPKNAFRIHGGYGYSKAFEIERLMREAPFLLIGDGTSEIQKTIISRGLLGEYKT